MSATTKTTPLAIPTSRELVDRINALAAERTALYRHAVDGLTAEQRARLKEIDAELATLWEQRRRARAGHAEDDAVPVRHAA
jgi:uncharacterized protein YecA (UPF0149 family)